MADVKLEVKKREPSTKGYLNKLRKAGYIPGVFYSNEQEPIPIYVLNTKLNPVVFTSEANVINIEIDGDGGHRCVLKDVQFDPVTDQVIHFDLYGVTAGQELQMEIPVNLIGDIPVGVRKGGLLQQSMHKLEISCLPRNIPESLDIDVSNLDFGDSIHVGDLNFENIKILNSEDVIVVTIAAPRKAEEITTEEEIAEGEEPAEPEVISKGKSEEEE